MQLLSSGLLFGASDEFGCSTAVHLMGLDHKRLRYRHNGRDFRLTGVAGKVVADILA